MKIKQSVLLVALSGIMLSACNSGGGTSSSAGATAQSAANSSANDSTSNNPTTANTPTTANIAGLSNNSLKISVDGIFDSVANELANEAVDYAGLGGLGHLAVNTFFDEVFGGSSSTPDYTPELNQILNATTQIQNSINAMNAQMVQQFGSLYQLTLSQWASTSYMSSIGARVDLAAKNQKVANAYSGILTLMTPTESAAFLTSGYTQAMENNLFSPKSTKYLTVYDTLVAGTLFTDTLDAISGSAYQPGMGWQSNSLGDYQKVLTAVYQNENANYPVISPSTRGGSTPVTNNSINNPSFVHNAGNNMFAAVYDFDMFAIGLYTSQLQYLAENEQLARLGIDLYYAKNGNNFLLNPNQRAKLSKALNVFLNPNVNQATNQANLSNTFIQLSANLIQQSQAEMNLLITNSQLYPVSGSYTGSCNPSWDNESFVLSQTPADFTPNGDALYSYDDGLVMHTSCGNGQGQQLPVSYSRNLCGNNPVSNDGGALYCSNFSDTNTTMTNPLVTLTNNSILDLYSPLNVVSGSQYISQIGGMGQAGNIEWNNNSNPNQLIVQSSVTHQGLMVLQYVGKNNGGQLQFGCMDNDLNCATTINTSYGINEPVLYFYNSTGLQFMAANDTDPNGTTTTVFVNPQANSNGYHFSFN